MNLVLQVAIVANPFNDSRLRLDDVMSFVDEQVTKHFPWDKDKGTGFGHSAAEQGEADAIGDRVVQEVPRRGDAHRSSGQVERRQDGQLRHVHRPACHRQVRGGLSPSLLFAQICLCADVR